MTVQDIKKSVTAKIIDFCYRQFGQILINNGETKANLLAADILDAVQQSADDMAKKAYGDCDVCYGKGYNSYMQPGNTASADFEGDKTVTTKPKLVYQLCKCARGRSLKQVIMGNPIWTDLYEKKAE